MSDRHYLEAILYLIFLLFREKFILVAQAGLVFAIFLLQTSKYRQCRHVTSCSVYSIFSALEFLLWTVTYGQVWNLHLWYQVGYVRFGYWRILDLSCSLIPF